MKDKYSITKYACYTVNVTMSVVANFPPLLFITFHEQYKLSFSLLGTLIFVNFLTQLCVDLIFSFYSHKFNISRTVRLTPFLAAAGLLIFAISPFFKGFEYGCLLCGTVIFSSSGGLAEVLISPVIAAIPSEDPDREMSKLHSSYAWGVVFVIIVSTLFLEFFGNENWQIMAFIWLVLPITACILYKKSFIPVLSTPKKYVQRIRNSEKQKLFGLFFLYIFRRCRRVYDGSMVLFVYRILTRHTQNSRRYSRNCRIRSYARVRRTLYSKFGKNIYKVMLISSAGASVCYIAASLSPFPSLGLAACALTGLCAAMLWPGSLIVLPTNSILLTFPCLRLWLPEVISVPQSELSSSVP